MAWPKNDGQAFVGGFSDHLTRQLAPGSAELGRGLQSWGAGRVRSRVHRNHFGAHRPAITAAPPYRRRGDCLYYIHEAQGPLVSSRRNFVVSFFGDRHRASCRCRGSGRVRTRCRTPTRTPARGHRAAQELARGDVYPIACGHQLAQRLVLGDAGTVRSPAGRSFYASGLIAAGCDVVTVQPALGHSSAALTLTTYSHLWPDASDRTRKAAGEMLDQALGAAADALRTDGTKRLLTRPVSSFRGIRTAHDVAA
jgi:hypothetical protein